MAGLSLKAFLQFKCLRAATNTHCVALYLTGVLASVQAGFLPGDGCDMPEDKDIHLRLAVYWLCIDRETVRQFEQV